MALRNELEGHNPDSKKLNGDDLSSLCRNLMEFHPVNSKIITLAGVFNEANPPQLVYMTNYHRICWTDLHQFLKIGRYMGKNMTFISARCNIYISRLCYDASVRLSVHLSDVCALSQGAMDPGYLYMLG